MSQSLDHGRTIARIKRDLDALFNNTTVAPATTRARLEEIRDCINSMIEVLPPGNVVRALGEQRKRL
jgi:hypothetical protein